MCNVTEIFFPCVPVILNPRYDMKRGVFVFFSQVK